MDDDKYIKYFNYGYFLSKKEPGVLEKLLVATKDKSEIHEPLKAGMQEHKRERVNEQVQRIKDKKKDRDRGLER